MKLRHSSIDAWEPITFPSIPPSATNAEKKAMRKHARLVEVARFPYEPKRGIEVVGYSLRPRGTRKAFPVILFARGGVGEFGKISDYLLYTTLAEIASWGYHVLATDYREEGDQYGGEELADLLHFKKIATTSSGCDEKRIGLFGFSRGGMMVYQALAKIRWARAAAVIGAPSDLGRAGALRPEMKKLFKERFGGSMRAIKERSAVHWPDRFASRTPLLIMHGAKDTRVSPLDSLDLSRGLLQANNPHQLVVFEGAGHALEEVETESMAMLKQWFDEHLTP